MRKEDKAAAVLIIFPLYYMYTASVIGAAAGIVSVIMQNIKYALQDIHIYFVLMILLLSTSVSEIVLNKMKKEFKSDRIKIGSRVYGVAVTLCAVVIYYMSAMVSQNMANSELNYQSDLYGRVGGLLIFMPIIVRYLNLFEIRRSAVNS